MKSPTNLLTNLALSCCVAVQRPVYLAPQNDIGVTNWQGTPAAAMVNA
jgi:hypothetical protein